MSGLEGKSVEDIQALAELANSLATDPKTRLGFLRLTKQAHPDTAVPEIDIPANLQAAMQPHIDRLDALSKRDAEREAERSVLARRQELIDSGIQPTEIPKVEKLMVEKGIANHKTAVEHLRMSERSAEPTPATTAPGLRRFDKPTVDTKLFNGDTQAWARSQAYAAIDEIRGRRPTAA